MRLFGSLAVLALVSFFFIPLILAQKESRLLPPSGWGGFRFIPCFLAEARPLAFRPPLGFLPSLRVHAGELAITNVLADFKQTSNYMLFVQSHFLLVVKHNRCDDGAVVRV